MRRALALLAVLLFAGTAFADRLAQNTTPAERARHCVFSEDFRSQTEVEANGASAIAGTPDFSPITGVTIQAGVDEIIYDINPSLFLADPISVRIDFTPSYNYDSNQIRYIYDTGSTVYHVFKTNDAGNHAMEIRNGNGLNAVIAEGVYGPYWLQNQRNVLVISATDGASKAWLNGNEIMDDASNWTADEETSLLFGVNFADSSYGDGTWSKFQVYHALLTAGEAQDFYDNSTYTWENQATAHYQMRLQDHDTTDVPLTRSGNANPLLGTIGTFEDWQGIAVGSCTDCPTGLSCNCTIGGDINPSAVQAYNGTTSAALDPGGAFYSTVYKTQTFEVGKAYQVSFSYYGHDGTEDAALIAGTAVLDETYHFATDDWTGAVTSLTITNAPQAWNHLRATIVTGASQKSSYVLGVTMSTSDGTRLYVDNFEVKELTNPLELVHAPVKQTAHGYDFDGTNDYLTGTIAASTFNSAEILIAIEFTPEFNWDEDAYRYIYDADDGTGGNRYLIHMSTNADNDIMVIWLGGTSVASIPSATYSPYWFVGQRNVLVISGDATNDLTDAWLNGHLILDGNATPWAKQTDVTRLIIGDYATGGLRFDGKIHSFMVAPVLGTPLQTLDIDHNLRLRGNDQ